MTAPPECHHCSNTVLLAADYTPIMAAQQGGLHPAGHQGRAHLLSLLGGVWRGIHARPLVQRLRLWNDMQQVEHVACMWQGQEPSLPE